MNIRYPLYEGVYRILTLQKVLPVFLSFRRISKEHKAMGCLYGCIGLFRLLHIITF